MNKFQKKSLVLALSLSLSLCITNSANAINQTAVDMAGNAVGATISNGIKNGKATPDDFINNSIKAFEKEVAEGSFRFLLTEL